MQIVVLGVNHETAPVALRERLAFAGAGGAEILRAITARGAGEAVLVTTCNRTELYALWPGRHPAPLADLLAERGDVSPRELDGRLYHLAERDAVAHLFRVASGVESMVVGEHQVLGQVREALEAAAEAGTAGPLLRRLFETAVRAGRRARSETAIGRGAFSVGGCAVQLARSVFGDLRGKRTLIVGAGKMSEAAVKQLADQGADSVLVANRTHDRACQLAESFGGRAVPYDDLLDCLSDVDIVITSTAAPHAIIRREEVARAMEARRACPLLLIDIAVPRDIEPAAGEIPGVHLHNIDDLSAVVAQDAAARQEEIAKVERIIQEEASAFIAWRTSLAVAPLIAALRGKFEQVRQEQLDHVSAQLARLSPRDRELVDALTAALVKKLLHTPTVRLPDLLQRGDGDDRAQAIRDLFALTDDSEEAGEP